jgi:hypothetical protein
MSNVRLDASVPDTVALVESMVASPVDPRATAEGGGSFPAPILVAVGALAVVAAISALAFRRSATATAD